MRISRNIVTICFAVVMVLLLESCGSVKYVPVESVRTDSIVLTKVDTVFKERSVEVHDSVLRVDSFYVKEFIREVVDTSGNVVRTDREVEKTSTRDTQKYNSLSDKYNELMRSYQQLLSDHAKSISEPYPVEVEKKLSLWERVKINLGGYALLVIVVYVLIIVARRKIKLKR